MAWLPLIFLLAKTFKLFNFPIFDLERTRWRLFKKHVMRTKLDSHLLLYLLHIRNNDRATQMNLTLSGLLVLCFVYIFGILCWRKIVQSTWAHTIFSEVRVARYLVFCVMSCFSNYAGIRVHLISLSYLLFIWTYRYLFSASFHHLLTPYVMCWVHWALSSRGRLDSGMLNTDNRIGFWTICNL